MDRRSPLRQTDALKPQRWSAVPDRGQSSALPRLPAGVGAAWCWHASNFTHSAQHLHSQAQASRYFLSGLNSTIIHQSKHYLIRQWVSLSFSHEDGISPTTTTIIALYLPPFLHSLHSLPITNANRSSQKAATSSERSGSSPVRILPGGACSMSLSYSRSFLVLNSWEDTNSFMQWRTKHFTNKVI